MIKCIDTRKPKQHLSGGESIQIAQALWKSGTPDDIRVLAVFNLGRATAFRSDNMETTLLCHLAHQLLGSVAVGTPQYHALQLKPDESKTNHEDWTQVTGCMIHVNPYLCPIASIGAWIVARWHPKIWNCLPPDFRRNENWWRTHLFTTFEGRNQRTPLSRDRSMQDVKRGVCGGLGWTHEKYEEVMKGVSTRLLRKTYAANADCISAQETQKDRLGLWDTPSMSRREESYANSLIPLTAARGMAGTPSSDVTVLHVTEWVPDAVAPIPTSLQHFLTSSDSDVLDILPSVPDKFIQELVPWLLPSMEELRDHDQADTSWSSEPKTSAHDMCRAFVLCIKVCICDWSVTRKHCPESYLFRILSKEISEEFSTWLDMNEKRYLASVDSESSIMCARYAASHCGITNGCHGGNQRSGRSNGSWPSWFCAYADSICADSIYADRTSGWRE
jgi:hypothetical protein